MKVITLMGNATRDAALEIPAGSSVCGFTIAVNDAAQMNLTTSIAPLGQSWGSCRAIHHKRKATYSRWRFQLA